MGKMGKKAPLNRPSCVSCKSKTKDLLLFEVSDMPKDDDTWDDTRDRVCICIDCIQDPISQRTVITSLVES